jgi:predicted nucleotidyltransferase
MLFDTLVRVARALNQAGTPWGIGASVLLHYHGLVDTPRDIDIMTTETATDTVALTLGGLGHEVHGDPGRSLYSTSRFLEYVVDGTDVDVMAGFAIKHENGTYVFPFGDAAVVMTKTVDDVTIPLTSLEDWYVLYQLMPGREPKVKLIENHLLSIGIADLPLLERALARELPPHVRARIERLVTSCRHPQH